MRGFLSAVAIAVVSVAPALAQSAAMNPAQAIAAVAAANGGEVTGVFEMQVASSAGAGFNYYLNSEKDYRSPANLAITIEPSGRNEIVAKMSGEPDAVFLGKRIRVTGTARRVPVGGSHFQTRVLVEHAAQIEIIG